MRFLYAISSICKGIYRGIHKEVKRLAQIANLNEMIKQRNAELILEYERLGEYIYVYKKYLEDERILQLVKAIDQLVQDVSECEQQLKQVRDE